MHFSCFVLMSNQWNQDSRGYQQNVIQDKDQTWKTDIQ